MRKLWAFLVALVAFVVWYGAESTPMDDDQLAERFRRSEGAGW